MSNSWRQAYTELTDFIAEHSEVKIRPDSIRIPGNVRPEFYRLFDAVRTASVEEMVSAFLDEAKTLSKNYLKAKEEVIKLLELHEITQPKPLHWFLPDPTIGLRRVLFNLLFDLLSGKVDIETFEARASGNLEASLRNLYSEGYEKWVSLSLIKLLEPDRLFQVIGAWPDKSELSHVLELEDPLEEEAPTSQESKHLSFEHGDKEMFIHPDFIVHSAKVDRYIAFRTEMEEAISCASNASKKREWYPLDSVAALGIDLIFIYVADNPDEISLVADKKKICRPDLILECKEQKDWYKKEGLENIKLHHDYLKPRLGTYIVSRESVPEQAYRELMPEQVSKKSALEQESKKQEPAAEQEPEKQGAGIYILTIGFDQSKLKPIISALIQTTSEY